MLTSEALRAIKKSNQEILRRTNQEVILRASRFANAILSGEFRSIFHIEKAYEFSNTEVFQLEHAPERIIWSRLDEHLLAEFPAAIANEDVLASRYQVFTEYDFVVLVDISGSMLLGWWSIYGGKPPDKPKGDSENRAFENIERMTWRSFGDQTKLFLLKYALASFLFAARANNFSLVVYLFGGGQITVHDSRWERNLPETLLTMIDEHYTKLVARHEQEEPKICEALKQVLARKQRAIVLCISDFMDTLCHLLEDSPRLKINDVILPLVQIAAHHRTMVLQINHWIELEAQEQEAVQAVKNVPYFNCEKYQHNVLMHYNKELTDTYTARAEHWSENLQSAFSSFGIKSCHLVGSYNDRSVDKKIYELGLATWRR